MELLISSEGAREGDDHRSRNLDHRQDEALLKAQGIPVRAAQADRKRVPDLARKACRRPQQKTEQEDDRLRQHAAPPQ